ncbi:23S rRNA (uracil(1939)-C(5))-methyltransferase RlmD [Clostridium perfringens]|uniref:23S rRNA (Uracil-5-)-methyltransferase RumA n=1 Tax=Clostridium perfringens (strain SM101 / Type A) TaxID=289380 RepID=Q0SW23_CLOPS|nr:23S rRNA (uracil(1939)-C(5))-methyltransferase RlmD [Clostridium perfringens]ABG87034.1 23S rRNA (uracil-5-)-methyltransferase RumA [Clostridium perfringens SM101]EJT5925699.1 23S rRNA (uracil(1939)-C(5))-methyltransferase RlmD [Clostridium perfringens]MBP2860388.1 23S rRNA (uracil(1939)-C(5))-methyltransferase RlmD [Clostridium perfringens]MDH5060697.1 23S rRNA (uracil-C(5))-methyltransferase RlmCD [Clostridium perfringens NCTC 8239]MDH5078012.1 23S rRNA (uracil-C(5))-methyltransferase Rlm
MVEKNKEYIFDIISQGYEGEGIAKIDNKYPIFIEGALKGEKVKVRIVKVNKNFAYGKLMEVLEASEERVNPPCAIYKRCGGCKLQHASYKAQLDFKWDRVKDCVSKIGKLDPSIVKYPLGMEEPWRYRNKVQLPIGLINGEVKIGFFAPRSHDIIDMESCLIQDEIGDKVVKLTREWIEKFNIRPYNVDGEYDEKGIVRHIMIRRGFTTNEVMVVLVTNGENLPHKEEFVDLMVKNIPGIKSVIQNINSKKTNVILGLESKTLWGEDTISDYIGDFRFNISPLSFFQVNPTQTEVLYGKALEYANLTGNEEVFDAYCGTGTITLFLSQKAKKVYGVEIIPQAIDNAWINAKENKVENVEFFVGESEVVIPDLINKGVKADVVVVDPPRKGCDKKLLDAITNIDAKKIVYVSCDPSTLGRDLKVLEENGYKTLEVQPVDMFPNTAHIENVALLIKK